MENIRKRTEQELYTTLQIAKERYVSAVNNLKNGYEMGALHAATNSKGIVILMESVRKQGTSGWYPFRTSFGFREEAYRSKEDAEAKNSYEYFLNKYCQLTGKRVKNVDFFFKDGKYDIEEQFFEEERARIVHGAPNFQRSLR